MFTELKVCARLASVLILKHVGVAGCLAASVLAIYFLNY